MCSWKAPRNVKLNTNRSGNGGAAGAPSAAHETSESPKSVGHVDQLFRRLRAAQAKEMNRLSREVAELKAISTVSVLVALGSEVVVVGEEAARKYDDACLQSYSWSSCQNAGHQTCSQRGS